MEVTTDTPWQRPPMLRWLCLSSAVNQVFCVFMYFMALLFTISIQRMPAAEVDGLMQDLYSRWVQPDQLERLTRITDMLRSHGMLFLSILLLRTVARSVGTWRMWNGHLDGLHIYISAQLLGVLLPMALVDRSLFDGFGLLMALNWSYLYWSVRRALH